MINKRLETIAHMIQKCMVAADIGTDHAFLPIYLIENGIAEKVIASDINKAPLDSALKNIKSRQLEDRIELVLSDGLSNINEDCDVIIIAGMGFYTCNHILDEADEKLDNCKQIIIEVNKDVDKLRKYLSDNDFIINNEEFIREKGHDYIIIDAKKGKHHDLNEKEILCGPILMQKKNKDYLEYVKRQIEKIDFIINKETDKDRINKLEIIKKYWQEI